MMEFFQTLLHPDREDPNAVERAAVARAANILMVGEFQLLQLAYYEWHGEDLPVDLVNRLFGAYMLKNLVPHWARHYARRIIEKDDKGFIDFSDPYYHRYDHDYHTWVPRGTQRFIVAAVGVFLVVFGSIYVANHVAGASASLLPPYFEEKDLRQTLPDMQVKNVGSEHFIAPGGAGNFSDVNRRPR
jgi:hypothetical protein